MKGSISFTTLLVFVAVSQCTTAQNEVMMKYRFWASNKPETQVSKAYVPGSSEMATPLSQEEMRRVAKAFFDYVDNQDSVLNYIDSRGEVMPSLLPAQSILAANKSVSELSTEKIGDYYLYQSELSLEWRNNGYDLYQSILDMVWLNNGVPMQGEEVLCERSQTLAEEPDEPAIAQKGLNRAEIEGMSTGLSFLETWNYNSESGFTKKVHLLGLLRESHRGGDLIGLKHMLQFRTDHSGKITEAQLLKRDVWCDVPFDACNSRGEVDYPCHEFVKNGFMETHLTVPDRYRLLNGLFRDALAGKIVVEQYTGEGEPVSRLSLSREELAERLTEKIRIWNRSCDPTAEPRYYDYISELEYGEIIGLRFLEDWYLDAENFYLEKRVKAIVVLGYKIDDGGELIGILPLGSFLFRLNPD